MKNKIVFITLLTIPLILVFKEMLFPGPLAFGDAPFFASEELKELINEPMSWTYRGANFGGVNIFLWLSPYMVLYGLLGEALNNDTAIRILFYFPALILSVSGALYVAKYFKLSSRSKLLASLLYVLNTYFVLLIDGGQVGVALAYGIFAWSFITLLKLLKRPTLNNFILTLVVSFFLNIADPRVFIIQVSTTLLFFVLTLDDKKQIKNVIHALYLGAALLLLNLYWLYPLFVNTFKSLSLEVASLNLTSLLNTLTLHQPHWYRNEFGQVSQPAVYFVVFPIIFISSLFTKNKKFASSLLLCFLIFAFLAKGSTEPLGSLYDYLLKLPFGFAFRDSSKFFAPLMLFASILVGLTSQVGRYKSILFYSLYIFIILTMLPAITGKLQFNLSNREYVNIVEVNKLIQKSDTPSRVLWLPEKYPTGFESTRLQSINGKDLANLRIFANRNAGSSDRLNFLHDENYLEWFSLLGIKNIVLTGDPRNVDLNDQELQSWNDLNNLVATTSGLIKKYDKPSVYQIEDSNYSPLQGSEKAILVIGSDNVVSPNIPMLFAEDEFTNLDSILAIPEKESLVIFFNEKNRTDLQLSFLKQYFTSVSSSNENQWSIWSQDQYLKSKYELLIRGMDTKEIDFGRGIAFSTMKGESMLFKLSVPQTGDYMLVVRAMSQKGSDPLSINYQGKTNKYNAGESYGWFNTEVTVNQTKNFDLEITNGGGLWVINTIALVPMDEWRKSSEKTNELLRKFETISESGFKTLVSEKQWQPIEYKYKSQVNVDVYSKPGVNWVFLTDSYHPLWKLRKGIEYFDTFPVYSSFNLFYLSPTWGDTSIEFKGQKNLRWGMYFSSISLLAITAILIYKKAKR